MGRDVFTGAAAWRAVDRFMEHENIRFVREPEGLEETWRDLTRSRSGANFWTDAYLAAFARTSGFTLVTFDRGFANLRDIPVKILRTPAGKPQ
jgi:predicted nucleic acid-binding protein